MNVEWVRVGDVLAQERVPVEPQPEIEYVTIGIRSFGKGIFHYEPKPGAQLGSLRFFEVQPGRLMISNIKGWEGAMAVSDPSDAGCLASNRFLSYAASDDAVDVRWARWFFLSDHGLRLIQRASPGSADRNRTLAIERFENLEIPLPPLGEQRAAADGLDRLYAATGHLAARSGDAAELVKALSVSTCARPDLSDEQKSAAGWRHTDLGSLMVPVVDRVSVSPGESYPNLGIYSFGRGVFEKPKIDGGSTSAQSLNRVRAGQFIYSRLFAFEGAYSHVPPAFDGYYVSNEFPTFDPSSEQLDARWLASCLRSPDRWAELAGSSKGLGVRRQRIPVEAVLAYRVWVPPIDQQRVMVQIMQVLETSQDWRDRAQERINSLLPAALNEAFAGLS